MTGPAAIQVSLMQLVPLTTQILKLLQPIPIQNISQGAKETFAMMAQEIIVMMLITEVKYFHKITYYIRLKLKIQKTRSKQNLYFILGDSDRSILILPGRPDL